MEIKTTAVTDRNTEPRTYSLPSYAPAFAKYMSMRDTSNYNQSISGIRPAVRSPVPPLPSYPQRSDSLLSQIRPAQKSPQVPRSLVVSGTSINQSISQVRSPQRSHRSLLIQKLDLACEDLCVSKSLLRSPLKSAEIQYLDLAVADFHPSISHVRPPVKSLTESHADIANLQNADDAGPFLQEALLDQLRPPRCSLVGRFLIDGGIEIHTMKKSFIDLWKPAKGLCIIDLGPNLFQFDFFDELDRERVIKGGPWTIKDKFLVIKNLETGQNPHKITLHCADFWVRVYELPNGLMSKTKVAIDIGNLLGTFVEADPINSIVKGRVYMRIRVSMDIRRRLERKIDVSKVCDKCVWVQLLYEGLSAYCFRCEKVGHYQNTCPGLKSLSYGELHIQ